MSVPRDPEYALGLASAPDLRRSPLEPRALLNGILSAVTWVASLLAAVPLFSVLYMLIMRGGARFSLSLFTELPPAGFEVGGGFGHAILGTAVMIGIAGLLSIPFGVISAVYLAELGPDHQVSHAARFAIKTMTGMPSILAGVFAYAAVVLVTGTYSAPAGGVALAVLMLPTIVLTAEESLKMVPRITKDAAHGMGCTHTQVILKVVLPTALPGVLTGVMLAVARAAGETAPLLFTALFSNFWLIENGRIHLMQPTASLAVLIYNFSGMPFENQIELAWAASLVLVIIVLIVNILSRIFGKSGGARSLFRLKLVTRGVKKSA